jgi:hypothetical protein
MWRYLTVLSSYATTHDMPPSETTLDARRPGDLDEIVYVFTAWLIEAQSFDSLRPPPGWA